MSARREQIAERAAWLGAAEIQTDGPAWIVPAVRGSARTLAHSRLSDADIFDGHNALSRSLFCLLMAIECMECEP